MKCFQLFFFVVLFSIGVQAEEFEVQLVNITFNPIFSLVIDHDNDTFKAKREFENNGPEERIEILYPGDEESIDCFVSVRNVLGDLVRINNLTVSRVVEHHNSTIHLFNNFLHRIGYEPEVDLQIIQIFFPFRESQISNDIFRSKLHLVENKGINITIPPNTKTRLQEWSHSFTESLPFIAYFSTNQTELLYPDDQTVHYPKVWLADQQLHMEVDGTIEITVRNALKLKEREDEHLANYLGQSN